MLPVTPQDIDAPDDESAEALAQSAWDALRILGFDTDGDKTPAAFTTLGYAQLGRTLIEVATDARACYDEALDAMPDEPRRVEPDAAFIDPDEWAYQLETARRDQKVHDECGPDRAAF